MATQPRQRVFSTRRENTQTGAPHRAQLPPSAPASSRFSFPPPLRPPAPVCVRRWRGDRESNPGSARGGATTAPVAGAGGAARWPPGAAPGLPKWGQSRRSRTRQLEGAGKEGPPNSSLAPPLHPLSAPALGESGVWRLLIIIPSDCFVAHGFSVCPLGLSAAGASVCGSPWHSAVDDEERSAGDSGPLRTGTGIRAANARATCPGPAQRQRHRVGRSR